MVGLWTVQHQLQIYYEANDVRTPPATAIVIIVPEYSE